MECISLDSKKVYMDTAPVQVFLLSSAPTTARAHSNAEPITKPNHYMIFDPYVDPAPIQIMSYIPALRTYTFVSPLAAQMFLPFYKNVARTLKQNHGVGTTGVFHSKSNPAQIIALVRYPSDSNPEEIIKSYLTSGAFTSDINGMDMKANIESVEEVLLEGPIVET